MTVNRDELRKTLGRFATGVTVITVAEDQRQVHGMTANSFTSVSLEPPLILVCIDERARTLPLVHTQQRFGINVLSHDQQALAEYFAKTTLDHDSAQQLNARFAFPPRGTPLLEPCLAQLECFVVSSQPAGDHTILLAEVEEAIVREGRPLLFYASRYWEIGDARSGP